MTNKPISIHWHSFCDIWLLKNDAFSDKLRADKHTDESITCLCDEVGVLNKWKLFATSLKTVKDEY